MQLIQCVLVQSRWYQMSREMETGSLLQRLHARGAVDLGALGS